MNVLALDAAGIPRRWIDLETAITHHARGTVIWSLGETIATFRGGVNNQGILSEINTTSIIALRGDGFNKFGRVTLTNRSLFSRDRHMCAYCGNLFGSSSLSRDHVLAKAHGGKDTWTNVVTACVRCNLRKGSKTLEQANMKLLYVPYEPNHYEHLILLNRNILADQMEYLLSGVPKHSRVCKHLDA